MNPTHKSTIDNAIAANFKEQIANLEKDIADVKSGIATAEKEYKRMISEDLVIVSNVSAETFTSRYLSLVSKLRKYKEDLDDFYAAYCNWKSLANYTD